jgi:hypothetical protein
MNVIDHGHDDPIPFDLTPEERDAAAFAQAQLRLDLLKRNAHDAKRAQGDDHA